MPPALEDGVGGAHADGTSREGPVAEWSWLGRVPYAVGLRAQEHLREQVASDAPDTLLLLEHDPVITLGRGASAAHVLASPAALQAAGISVARTSRGGDVTYHGPGQLTGYPIFRVRRGVRAHVRAMAEGIALVLRALGISAEWRDSVPGLWVGDSKICAFGVHVRKRVAMHGFALNVNNSLDGFRTIVPCGLPWAGVTSTAALLGVQLDLERMGESIARAFAETYGMKLDRIPANSSRLQIAIGNQ